MDDDELTRLAIKLLEKEGQRFVRERTLTKPGPLKANKRFLTATLKQNEMSNRRINRQLESKNQDKCLHNCSTNSESSGTSKTSLEEASYTTEESKIMPTNTCKQKNKLVSYVKNRTSVSRLTKDSKVSFKFSSKRPFLNKDRSSINQLEETVTKTVEHEPKSSNEVVNIINISDDDSVISVSSSFGSADPKYSKKSKKRKKEKKKKKHKKRHKKEK